MMCDISPVIEFSDVSRSLLCFFQFHFISGKNIPIQMSVQLSNLLKRALQRNQIKYGIRMELSIFVVGCLCLIIKHMLQKEFFF